MTLRKLKKLKVANNTITVYNHFADRLSDELDGILCATKLLDYDVEVYDDIFLGEAEEMSEPVIEYGFIKDISKKVVLTFLLSKSKTLNELLVRINRDNKLVLKFSIKPLHSTEIEMDMFFDSLKKAVLGD
jgi:hypothetical protein